LRFFSKFPFLTDFFPIVSGIKQALKCLMLRDYRKISQRCCPRTLNQINLKNTQSQINRREMQNYQKNCTEVARKDSYDVERTLDCASNCQESDEKKVSVELAKF
jgi:hypothetical protein